MRRKLQLKTLLPGTTSIFEQVLPGTSGQRSGLIFTVFDPNKKQVTEFDIVHERSFHLFIISQDLKVYQHIHPLQQPDGSLVVDTVLPQPGNYHIICDFSPTAGFPQVLRRHLRTSGVQLPLQPVQARIIPDRVLTKSVNGTRFELILDPAVAVAGALRGLTAGTDESTGKPVEDLQPYLGAWGHTVIMSEDATDYLHSHPTVNVRKREDGQRIRSPVEVSFNTFFSRAGRYRIWSQFQRRDTLATVSFDVEVAQLQSLARWEGNGWRVFGTGHSELGPIRALALSGVCMPEVTLSRSARQPPIE
ncbi:MAG: hypothetical protein WKF37_23985 [Bryobacteraceae bacterium]